MDSYHPKPIDTSHVELSPEVLALTERLAENAHDHWAIQRLRDGWTLGPTRNDAAKQHPCLIPYDDLPEGEKAYDRTNAMETLKAIAALGYRIVAPKSAAG
jgi:ryanodine receptor 2